MTPGFPAGAATTAAALTLISGNLPAPVSSLVGRHQEAEQVTGALARSRLVTLTGVGGVGKTRLAIRAATAWSGRAPDGVWFVDLAQLSDAALVPHAVISALGLPEESPADLVSTLVGHLRPRQLLLVLDNCEHVVAACAELVDRVLHACAGVSILVTSREPLGIVGEVVIAVPLLSLPPPDDHSPAALKRAEATRLFIERARSTRPDFVVDERAAAAIGEICRRLEGLPLAIELAAARVRALSPLEIADNLQDRFRFLRSGGRTASRRHRTLEAAIDWSYHLLPESERAVFTRLSVFSGPFSLEAVEAVCAGERSLVDDVAEVLDQLVAKSLVVAVTTAAGARFRLLETLREYARRKLDPEKRSGLEHAYAAYYLGLAERAEPELFGRGQQPWTERLETEHDNIRAALEWFLTHGDARSAATLASSLTTFWRLRGRWSEGRQWISRAVEGGDRLELHLRAKASWGIGLLSGLMGDQSRAVAAAERSYELFRKKDDRPGTARALTALALVWVVQQPPKALELAEEAVRLARDEGVEECLAEALALAGHARMLMGRMGEGQRLFEESLAVARSAGDLRSTAAALIGCAATAEVGASRGSLEEGLSTARRLGGPYEVAQALLMVANIAMQQRSMGRARELLEDCLVLAQDIGSPLLTARALGGLARVALVERRVGSARLLFDQAISVARQAQLSFVLVRLLVGRGRVASRQHDTAAAAALWTEALEIARSNADESGAAQAQLLLAELARKAGNDEQAGALAYQALTTAHRVGDHALVAPALAALGGLAAVQGRLGAAARMLGAARFLAELLPAAPLAASFAADVALVRSELAPEEFTARFSEGESMTVDEMVEYASRGRGKREQRPTTAWASLTRAERQVVALVAEGLTNREIGERLFISPRTVDAHVSHIFGKLGVSSRKELASLAASRGGPAT